MVKCRKSHMIGELVVEIQQRKCGGVLVWYCNQTQENSFPPTWFGGILLQPTTWQVNKPSTCTFNHITFLMSHVIFSNNTRG